MASFTSRKRADGTTGHTAQIRIKRGGIVIHTESQTFNRRQQAELWAKKRESALAEPGALEALLNKHEDPPLAKAIERYTLEHRKGMGKTKTQVLRTISADRIAGLPCSKITSQVLLDFLDRLENQPQTKGNYLSHLGSIIRVAQPAWGYPLSVTEYEAARTVAQHLGAVSRSKQRDRRPTLDELDRLLEYFGSTRAGRADSIPMQEVILYAIFSTRRAAEITRQVFEDLDATRADIWVRDMKHPGEKIGNHVRVVLPPEALAVVLKRRQSPEQTGRIFPHNEDSISAAFTRACQILEIDDLHFHDLRHDGISRLFELGWNIPQVAAVSGHRSWNSLKRYTHIRQTGDKYAEWPWFGTLGISLTKPDPAS